MFVQNYKHSSLFWRTTRLFTSTRSFSTEFYIRKELVTLSKKKNSKLHGSGADISVILSLVASHVRPGTSQNSVCYFQCFRQYNSDRYFKEFIEIQFQSFISRKPLEISSCIFHWVLPWFMCVLHARIYLRTICTFIGRINYVNLARFFKKYQK